MKTFRLVSFLTLSILVLAFLTQPLAARSRAQDLTYRVYLPLVTSNGCADITGETYGTLVVNPPPTDRPAEQHADLNLALRGYVATTGTLGLVDYAGSTDGRSPKLFSLFSDNRVPTFTGVSQVNAWEWETNSRADPITYPPVTLATFSVAPGEILSVPHSEYNIGSPHQRPPRGVFRDGPEDDSTRYEVLVLYASDQRITLKYTREDNVVKGYTLHVENVCVAPALLDLYRTQNASGRTELPALKQGQAFGRAMSTEIGVVIRDNGTFMDPRSHKDWW